MIRFRGFSKYFLLALFSLAAFGWIMTGFGVDPPVLDPGSFSNLSEGRMGRFGLQLLFAHGNSLGIALSGSFLACSFGLAVGFGLGLAKGWMRRTSDALLQTFMAIPVVLYFLVSLVIFPPGPTTLVFVFAATLWLEPARMIQARMREIETAPFIHVSRMMAWPKQRIFFREWLPNLTSVFWVSFLIVFLNAILLEAILGYLGLGLRPGTPTLGRLIEWGAKYWPKYPAMLLAPLALEVTWIIALRGLLRQADRRDRPLRLV